MPIIIKTAFVLLCCMTSLSGRCQQKDSTHFEIPEANMSLDLPNSKWRLTTHAGTDHVQYLFKRDPITNTEGSLIVPAIMVYIEDAGKYQQDVTLFSIEKQGPFLQNGVTIDQMLIHSSKNYPLSYKNAYFYRSSYMENARAHNLYMIHIINKDSKGIQIYLDMTKDIEKDYEQEFWTVIRSIRETPH